MLDTHSQMVDFMVGCRSGKTEGFTHSTAGMLLRSVLHQKILTYKIYHARTRRTLVIHIILSGISLSPKQGLYFMQEISQVLRQFLQDTLPSIQGTLDLPNETYTHT